MSTQPEQQATDPRKPAWDAVFAYIRTLPRESHRPDVVERNAMIWRGVNAALVALGYPGEYEQAAPEQPELHQRLADALQGMDAMTWLGTRTGIRDHDERITQRELAARLTAALQPELAELAALRGQLALHRDALQRAEALRRSTLAAATRAESDANQLREQLTAAQDENARLRGDLAVAESARDATADAAHQALYHHGNLGPCPYPNTCPAFQCGPACSEQHTYDGCCQLSPAPAAECPLPSATCVQRQCAKAAARPTT
ncbi:hypothetical protein [Kitasatospora sp. NPDC004272]